MQQHNPDIIHFVTFFRHILAAVHFNFNLQREVKHREKDGAERVKVCYPKFKNGEATVRNVRVTQNYGKHAWSVRQSKHHCS